MIDAHFHSWQIARGDYGWLTPALGPLYRDVQVADWQALSQPLGVTGGVLVQAAPTAAETRFLLAQAQTQASVLGVVGWVDMLGDNLTGIIPGSSEAERVKQVLIARGAWSQYLEVSIGPDAEILTKAPVLSAVSALRQKAPRDNSGDRRWRRPIPYRI